MRGNGTRFYSPIWSENEVKRIHSPIFSNPFKIDIKEVKLIYLHFTHAQKHMGSKQTHSNAPPSLKGNTVSCLRWKFETIIQVLLLMMDQTLHHGMFHQ